MKILVISSCSSSQKHKPSNKLRAEDFRSDALLNRRKEELRDYKELAGDMYEGLNHKLLMDGLRKVREHNQYGKTSIDLYIISTGYGLINEHHPIVPYDVKPRDAIWKQFPYCICENVLDIIHNYDLVFFLLGQDVEALQLADQSFKYSGTATLIFLIAPTHSKKHIPPHLPLPSNIRVVNTGKALEKDVLGSSGYMLGGFVFKKLCKVACCEGFNLFEAAKENPWSILDIARNR